MNRCAARFLIGMVTYTVLSGCADGEPASENQETVPLYFEPIGYGHRANLSDTTELAIRTRDRWLPVRDSLHSTVAFDSVDFNQAILLVAALPQTTSGYSVEFRSVESGDSAVVAEYVVHVPSDDCLTAHAEVVPFQVVLVRRTELPVRFERGVEEYRCTFGPRR